MRHTCHKTKNEGYRYRYNAGPQIQKRYENSQIGTEQGKQQFDTETENGKTMSMDELRGIQAAKAS
jgi:hypothetical protein